jgi:hypothetical protein
MIEIISISIEKWKCVANVYVINVENVKNFQKRCSYKTLSTSYKSQFNLYHVVTLTHTISSCNHSLIFCIWIARRKKLQQFCGCQVVEQNMYLTLNNFFKT